MRFITTLCLVATTLGSIARAQSRHEPLPSVDFTLERTSDDEPFRRVLAFRANAATDMVADRRLLYFEVRAPDSRRGLRCEHPERRRAVRTAVHLEAGERWAEWIDLREYCWGRALETLRSGAEITAFYRVARRQLLGPLHVDAVADPAEADSTAPIRIVLSDRDVRRAGHLSFRVRVLAREGRVRAYVRSDHIRFRVHGPEGDFDCGMAHGQGAAPPELFGWISSRSGPSFSLDPSFYCSDSFRAAGVYEVTPMLDIEQSGARWGFDTPTGTFVGVPALIRIREGDPEYSVRHMPERDAQ